MQDYMPYVVSIIVALISGLASYAAARRSTKGELEAIKETSANDRRKKLKFVGDCYRKYCGNRPMKAKEFRRIQEKLYDEIIMLEKNLIAVQLKPCSDG